MIADGVTLQPLEQQEMLGLSGGMDELAPNFWSSLAYDIGWVVGRVAAGVVAVATTPPPASNYYYCKTGYPN